MAEPAVRQSLLFVESDTNAVKPIRASLTLKYLVCANRGQRGTVASELGQKSRECQAVPTETTLFVTQQRESDRAVQIVSRFKNAMSVAIIIQVRTSGSRKKRVGLRKTRDQRQRAIGFCRIYRNYTTDRDILRTPSPADGTSVMRQRTPL